MMQRYAYTVIVLSLFIFCLLLTLFYISDVLNYILHIFYLLCELKEYLFQFNFVTTLKMCLVYEAFISIFLLLASPLLCY